MSPPCRRPGITPKASHRQSRMHEMTPVLVRYFGLLCGKADCMAVGSKGASEAVHFKEGNLRVTQERHPRIEIPGEGRGGEGRKVELGLELRLWLWLWLSCATPITFFVFRFSFFKYRRDIFHFRQCDEALICAVSSVQRDNTLTPSVPGRIEQPIFGTCAQHQICEFT